MLQKLIWTLKPQRPTWRGASWSELWRREMGRYVLLENITVLLTHTGAGQFAHCTHSLWRAMLNPPAGFQTHSHLMPYAAQTHQRFVVVFSIFNSDLFSFFRSLRNQLLNTKIFLKVWRPALPSTIITFFLFLNPNIRVVSSFHFPLLSSSSAG